MKLGILCGGGPAPGMNSVISAATIEARNSGWDVLGIMDGFQHLIEGRVEQARPLSITDVSRIHVQGGSILRTSRANPTVRDERAADPGWRLHACLESLQKLGIGALVTIGGDDTAFSASRLQVFRMIEYPSSLPSLFAGLRIAATLAVIGVVVGELVGGNLGLGYLLTYGEGQGNTAMVFVTIIVLTFIGILAYSAVVLTERKVLHYLPKAQHAAT